MINFWNVDGYTVFNLCDIPNNHIPPEWMNNTIGMRAFNQTIGPALLEGQTSGSVMFNSSDIEFHWTLEDNPLNVISAEKMIAWMKITLPETEDSPSV